jgi:aspartate carbamoyltransferase catalytic subunit
MTCDRVRSDFNREKDYATRLGRERAAKDIEEQRLRGEAIHTNKTEDLHYEAVLKQQPIHHGLEVAKEVATSLVSEAFKSP